MQQNMPILAVAAGCSPVKVHKQLIVPVPVICEIQTPVGTHVGRCTCWDAGLIAQMREETGTLKIQTEFGIDSCHTGVGCDDGKVGRR